MESSTSCKTVTPENDYHMSLILPGMDTLYSRKEHSISVY